MIDNLAVSGRVRRYNPIIEHINLYCYVKVTVPGRFLQEGSRLSKRADDTGCTGGGRCHETLSEERYVHPKRRWG